MYGPTNTAIIRLRNFAIPFIALMLTSISGYASFVISADDSTGTDKRKYENIIESISDSINIADINKMDDVKSDLYMRLGNLQLRRGNFTDAFSDLFKSLEIRQKNGSDDDSRLANIYASLGEAYRAIAKYENSLEYLEKAKIIFGNIKDQDGTAYVYNRIASVHYEMATNRNDTALVYTAEKEVNVSLGISNSGNNKNLIVSNYNLLGAIHSFLGYREESRKYLLQALASSDSIPDFEDAPNIMNNIANTYYFEKNYDKAIEIANVSLRKSEKLGIKIYQVEALRVLMNCYSEMGDYKKAYESLWIFYNSWNALFNEKMENNVQILQNKFDADLNSQIKSSEKSRNIFFLISILIVLGIIGTGTFLRMRSIHRINKNLEEQRDTIVSQKEDLEKLNQTKDKYFSILSHDLRNPLSGIHGFSNMLNSGFNDYSDDEKKEFIGYIKASSESMYRVIEKVLTWSRLQSHAIKVHTETLNLKREINNIINLQRPNATSKGIFLENKIDEEVKINSDKSIIDTVVSNLIDNSIKFTNAGGRITVNTETIDGFTRVSVSDTGVGMSEQKIQDILSGHAMITTRGTNNERGTGFGLSICIEMLGLIGSELQIESKAGEGTKFSFKVNNGASSST